MDNEKLIVGLLLITVILSIVSVIITLSINFDDLKNTTSEKSANAATGYNAGNVVLVIEPNPENQEAGK